MCRFDHEKFQQEGLQVVTWTVNSKDEQEHFYNLGVPYMTDHIS